MKLIPQFALALALALGAVARPPAALGAVATEKRARLAKLQKLNRVFQVCYGRSLRRDETRQILPLNEQQLAERLIASEELSRVFARRLADFTGGSKNAASRAISQRLRNLAHPTDKLDIVLGAVDRDHHKGEQCGDKSNSICFATWLVTTVAPTLGYDWIKEREAQLPTWTYAKLLEEIARSSINQ